MAKQLKIRTEGAVQVIEFYNPPHNYITHIMLRELYTHLLKARSDDSVRVLVLTGGLEDAFLTHYDVADLLEYRRATATTRSVRATHRLAYILAWLSSRLDRWAWLDHMAIGRISRRTRGEQSIYYWMRCIHILDSFPKPLIAAVNGIALGGGCEMTLCCDFRYMADDERYRIGLPEILLGITPGGTGTPLRLPRIVGEAKALEMLLTGRIYRPSEAEAMGLIHQHVSAVQLMPTVMALAQKLSRGAPLAQAAVRAAVRQGSRVTWPQGRVLELAGAIRAMNSEDADRGMSAYVADIAPQFEGVDLEKRLALYGELYDGRLTDFKSD